MEYHRFKKNDLNVIYDRETGLEWFLLEHEITFKETMSQINALSIDGGGWRMPTINELCAICPNIEEPECCDENDCDENDCDENDADNIIKNDNMLLAIYRKKIYEFFHSFSEIENVWSCEIACRVAEYTQDNYIRILNFINGNSKCCNEAKVAKALAVRNFCYNRNDALVKNKNPRKKHIKDK